MRLNSAVLVAILACPAVADLGDQLFKLLPNDGASEDFFGFPVAISGDIAIVGKHGDDQNGSRAGAAYLFDVATGLQIAKLLAADGAVDDHFGISVAIDGATAIVGAHSDDIIGPRSGSAYIFDAITGEQLHKLVPDDGWIDDFFGSNVAISGNVAIVGAEGDDDNGDGAGSAYLFNVTTGEQLFKLLPDDGQAYDSFSTSVAISGKIAIVGATGDTPRGRPMGVAYLFDATTGQQIGRLLPNDGAPEDGFGGSVAISGNIGVVGARGDDDNGDRSGSAYVFNVSTGEQLFKLLPDDGAIEVEFGQSVAIHGNAVIVGAYGANDNGEHAGAAYLFDTTTGKQIFKLLADDGAEQDHFGIAVAIDAGIAVIGADLDDDNGRYSGSAYLFDAGRCPADIDGDGDADSKDFFAYLDFFASGDDRADIDGDGDIDAEDFFGYLDLFVKGC